MLDLKFTAELQKKHPWNDCESMSQMLAGPQPTGVPPLSSKYRTPVTLRCMPNLFPGISGDEKHVVITGSNPITVTEQACSVILCNDTRSVSAETGKQWFLPILFLLTLNGWHGAKFSMLKVVPCVTSNRIQVSDNLRLFQTWFS